LVRQTDVPSLQLFAFCIVVLDGLDLLVQI